MGNSKKAICVKEGSIFSRFSITKGMSYEIEDEDELHLKIKDDTGKSYWLKREVFKIEEV